MRLHRRWGSVVLLAVLVTQTPRLAEAGQDDMRVLQRRFSERYPRVLQLKDRGIIGETWRGFLARVEPLEPVGPADEATGGLLEAENADRVTLYELLAQQIRADVSDAKRNEVTAALVAQRNAQRNFENARPQHFLLVADHTWIIGRDLDRYRRLLELKSRGQVGETGNGLVEPVEGASLVGEARALVEEENRVRRERYARLAAERQTSADAIARAYGERLLKDVRPGHAYKGSDGVWRRRPG